MKTYRKPLAGILAALLMTQMSVSAEETAESGLYFDFNGDGVTTGEDWASLQNWVRDYKMNGDFESYYGGQEVPATINLLIDEMAHPKAASSSQTPLSEAEEFYLISGYSSPVKDQSPFGSCWAFSTMSSLESNALLRTKGIPKLSDVSSLNFGKEDDTFNYSELFLALENGHTVRSGSQKGEGNTAIPDTPNSTMNIGGFASTSQIILSSWNGSVTEEEEPYVPLSADEEGAVAYGYHNEEKDLSEQAAFHLQNLYYLDGSSDYHVDLVGKKYIWDDYDESAIQRMKDAMTKYGALIFCYEADQSMPGQEGSGAFFNYQNWCQYDDSTSIAMNHAVSAVGWNDHFPKENFVTEKGELPPGDGAWLIKNSWGNYSLSKASYGDRIDEMIETYKGTDMEAGINLSVNYGIPDEEGHGSGYFWLSYYDHTLLSAVALDAEIPEEGYSCDNLYQYDYYHGPDFYPLSLFTKGEGAKTANIFVSERAESLSAISLYVPVNGAEVTAEVYLLNKEETVPDTAPASVIRADCDRGFYTLHLEDAVELSEGQRFLIVSSILSHSETDDEPMSWLNLETGIKEALQSEDNVNSQTLHMVCNEGESLYSLDGGKTWQSPSLLNSQDAGQVFEFGNARIKAYTVTTAMEGTPVVISAPSPAVTAETSSPSQPASSAAAGLILALAGISAFLVWFFLCRD